MTRPGEEPTYVVGDTPPTIIAKHERMTYGAGSLAEATALALWAAWRQALLRARVVALTLRRRRE